MKKPTLTLLSLFACAACSHTPLADRQHQMISITSTPSPAHIYVNGEHRGLSPLELDLEMFQEKMTYMTALPTLEHQYRQDVSLAEGALPTDILFYMDIPSKTDINTTDETPNENDDRPCATYHTPILFFDNAEYQLTARHKDKLACFYQALTAQQYLQVRINGFADENSSTEYNMNLSLKRAQSTADELINLGIEKTNIKVIGFGEVVSVDESFTPQPYAENRKVTLQIISK